MGLPAGRQDRVLAGPPASTRAIIHFVYLTCSYPGVYTSDHFRDVTKLELDPAFADYVGEAFKPLGVYINFFQPTLTAGAQRTFKVMMVNDLDRTETGELRLSLEREDGTEVARSQVLRSPAGTLGQDTSRGAGPARPLPAGRRRRWRRAALARSAGER